MTQRGEVKGEARKKGVGSARWSGAEASLLRVCWAMSSVHCSSPSLTYELIRWLTQFQHSKLEH